MSAPAAAKEYRESLIYAANALIPGINLTKWVAAPGVTIVPVRIMIGRDSMLDSGSGMIVILNLLHTRVIFDQELKIL